MSVGVMTVGVMSVEEITVGVMTVRVMTVGVMRHDPRHTHVFRIHCVITGARVHSDFRYFNKIKYFPF